MIPPRTLFGKIFLSFWIVEAAIIATVLLFFRVASPSPPRQSLPLLGEALSLAGWNALQLYEKSGVEAVDSYLDQVEHASGMRAYLLSPDGTVVSGKRSISPEELRIARTALHSGQVEFTRWDSDAILARPIMAHADQSPYVIVARVSHGAIAPRPPMPQTLRDLSIAIAISGLVCFLLARYLTAPIVRLRSAAQQLSKGDLTARAGKPREKRADELADLVADFDQMAAQIESLVYAQKRLMSDVSHELRSPLTRINLGLELMRKIDHPGVATAIERLEQETERLNEMIGKLLMLSRVEAGDKLIVKTAVNLESLLRDVVTDADFEARNLGRRVVLFRADHCEVLGNAELLRSAFENVIRNAIRYTAEGTIVEVRLTASGNLIDGRATVQIRDHGPGVPDSSLEDLFRPFYRLDDSRENETGGVGLGLAITKRAVILHGGRVAAANEVSGGLRVEIDLPTNSPPADSSLIAESRSFAT